MNRDISSNLVKFLFEYSNLHSINDDDEIVVEQEELRLLGDLGYLLVDRFTKTGQYLKFAKANNYEESDLGGYSVDFDYKIIVVDITLFGSKSEEARLIVNFGDNGQISSIEFRKAFEKNGLYFTLTF